MKPTGHPSSLRRCFVLAPACLALLASSGCLMFEKQVVVLLTPEKGKEARALVIYEGFHAAAAADPGKSLERARRDLTRLALEQNSFYPGTWLFPASLAEAEGDSAEARKEKAYFRKHIQISKLTFFQDKNGRLCGYQTIVIPEAAEVLAHANESISALLLRDGLKDPPEWVDEETRGRLLEAAKNRLAWLGMEPGRVSGTIPTTPRSATQLKRYLLRVDALRKVEEALVGDLKALAENRQQHEHLRTQVRQLRELGLFLSELPLSFRQDADRMVFLLGLGEGMPIRLDVPATDTVSEKARANDAALLDHARSLAAPFAREADTESIVRAFVQKK